MELAIDRANILEAGRNPTARVQEIMKGVIGPIVHNVVMSGKACLPPGFEWDVQRMAFPAYGKYAKGEFAAPCTLAFRGLTCNFFRTGKINIMGATSVAESVKRLYEGLLYLEEKTGFSMRVHDLKLTNMQSTVYLNYTLDIDALYRHLIDKEYEPENISFLKYKLLVTGGKVTFLVYKSGRIVMTQAKSEEQFNEARDIFLPFLAQFALKYSPGLVRDTDPLPLRPKQKRKRAAAVPPLPKKKRKKPVSSAAAKKKTPSVKV